MHRGLKYIRDVIREEMDTSTATTQAAIVTQTCARLRPYSGLDLDELVHFTVAELLPDVRRSAGRAVVHIDGKTYPKRQLKMTLEEVDQNIRRRQEGIAADTKELRHWRAFRAEYRKRLAGRNPADHIAEEFFSEDEIKAIWAAI
jgi:hypothetical protein